MFARPAATRVMIGRATMKNPWIFRQIADLLAGRPAREATLAERRDLMLGALRRDRGDAPPTRARPSTSCAR